MQQQAPTYFLPYGPYSTVASNTLSTSPTHSHLAAGLPAPWTTLTNSATNTAMATQTNPFLAAQYTQPQSQTNLAVQPSTPQSNASTWVEMGAVQPKQAVVTIQSKTKELLRRCKHCGGYYLDDNDACSYHPGHFRSPYQTTMAVWSCCKSSQREAPGCKHGKHVEDVDASRKLDEYGRLVEALASTGVQQKPRQRVPVPLQAQMQQQPAAKSPTSAQKSSNSPKSPSIGSPETNLLIDLVDDLSIYPKPVEFMAHHSQPVQEEEDDFNPRAHEKSANPTPTPSAGLRVSENQLRGAAPGCVKHFVKPTDTIVGLCMQYGITKPQLIEANRGLSNDNLYAYYELQIPQPTSVKLIVSEDKSEEDSELEKQKRLQQIFIRFKRSERVTDEEAKYYLTLADWDYDEAVEERRLDVQFEQTSRSDPSKVKFSHKYEPHKFVPTKSPSSRASSWF